MKIKQLDKSYFNAIQETLHKSPTNRRICAKDVSNLLFMGAFNVEKLIGLVAIRKWNLGVHEVRSLYVEPDFRKEGVGAELINEVISSYPGLLIGFTTLENEGSIRTFLKNGFTRLNLDTTLILIRRSNGQNYLRGEVFP